MPRFSLPSPCISTQIGVTAVQPSGLLIHHVVWILVAHFCWLSMVGDYQACSPAHWQNPTGTFSCISYRHCAVSAYKLLLFHFYFVLAYTYLFSAKLRSGCLFKFRPCVDCLRPWTMIFPWIFLFLYRHVFACSNKQNEYSQINPRRTTFPRRFVASNKLNINQLKFRNYEKV